MDLLIIIFSIISIIYGIYLFISVKKFCNKYTATRNAMQNDEHLQNEFKMESKRLSIMTTVLIVLFVLLNVINLILIILGV